MKKKILEVLRSRTSAVTEKKLRKAVFKLQETGNDDDNEKSSKSEKKVAFSDALASLERKRKICRDESGLIRLAAEIRSDELSSNSVAVATETVGAEESTQLSKNRPRYGSDCGIEVVKKRRLSDASAESVSENNKIITSFSQPDNETNQRPHTVRSGSNSILLFYAYCTPQMSRAQQDGAIEFCRKVLTENKCTGRLRIGKEGYNATLTGPHDGVRAFTAALRQFDPSTFGQTDFKYVDNQPDNQLLKGLKVFPVTEIVTYGFKPEHAPLELGGTHLKPADFHKAMEDPNSVIIDVRNFNETAIGRFAPPGSLYLDPMMRRSTEFPDWIEKNRETFKGKNVLMYCTAGVRCEVRNVSKQLISTH
jgi:UPF0176 acylphosphatase like domain